VRYLTLLATVPQAPTVLSAAMFFNQAKHFKRVCWLTQLSLRQLH
jgi:hypothetical protein